MQMEGKIKGQVQILDGRKNRVRVVLLGFLSSTILMKPDIDFLYMST